MNPYLLSLILSTANTYKVDPALVMATIAVESNFKANAVGKIGEQGYMQLNPRSYPKLSKKTIAMPEWNIKLGITKLNEARNKCKHKLDNTWVVCYNRGIKGGSRLRYPVKDRYYKKVMRSYFKMSKVFLPGQRVAIKNCHYNMHTGFGVVILDKGKGCYLIEVDETQSLRIPIDDHRLMDELEYNKKKSLDKEE